MVILIYFVVCIHFRTIMSNKYEIMEKRDEEQILAEAQGNIIEEMFYKFPINGKEVTGISWVGTKEIARKYGGIRMGLPNVTEMNESFVCSIQAEDTRNEITLVGSSQQPKNMTLRSGEVKPDPFAYVKCVSKAQRNAIRSLIPETFLLEMEKAFSAGKTLEKNMRDRVPGPDALRREAVANVKTVTEETTFDLSIDGIKAALTSLGYPGKEYEIIHDEPTRMYVIVKAPWVDDWPKYQSDIRELGGEYNAEQKRTVFRY